MWKTLIQTKRKSLYAWQVGNRSSCDYTMSCHECKKHMPCTNTCTGNEWLITIVQFFIFYFLFCLKEKSNNKLGRPCEESCCWPFVFVVVLIKTWESDCTSKLIIYIYGPISVLLIRVLDQLWVDDRVCHKLGNSVPVNLSW